MRKANGSKFDTVALSVRRCSGTIDSSDLTLCFCCPYSTKIIQPHKINIFTHTLAQPNDIADDATVPAMANAVQSKLAQMSNLKEKLQGKLGQMTAQLNAQVGLKTANVAEKIQTFKDRRAAAKPIIVRMVQLSLSLSKHLSLKDQLRILDPSRLRTQQSRDEALTHLMSKVPARDESRFRSDIAQTLSQYSEAVQSLDSVGAAQWTVHDVPLSLFAYLMQTLNRRAADEQLTMTSLVRSLSFIEKLHRFCVAESFDGAAMKSFWIRQTSKGRSLDGFGSKFLQQIRGAHYDESIKDIIEPWHTNALHTTLSMLKHADELAGRLKARPNKQTLIESRPLSLAHLTSDDGSTVLDRSPFDCTEHIALSMARLILAAVSVVKKSRQSYYWNSSTISYSDIFPLFDVSRIGTSQQREETVSNLLRKAKTLELSRALIEQTLCAYCDAVQTIESVRSDKWTEHQIALAFFAYAMQSAHVKKLLKVGNIVTMLLFIASPH